MGDKARVMLDALNEVYQLVKVGSVVEVGCVREMTEYPAEGFSTFYLAEWCKKYEQTLHSIDNDPEHIHTAMQVLIQKGLTGTTKFYSMDGVEGLLAVPPPIMFLYLDGGSPENTLMEFQMAQAFLHPDATVVIDDCHTFMGNELGKGTSAIPWAMAHGWNSQLVPTHQEYRSAVLRRR